MNKLTIAARCILLGSVSEIRHYAGLLAKRNWFQDDAARRKNAAQILQKAISMEGKYNNDGTWDGRISVVLALQKSLRHVNRTRVAAGDNPRGVCRRCGCSMGDPCIRPGTEPEPGPVVCRWINNKRTLCSHCKHGFCDLNCYLDGKCGNPRGKRLASRTVVECRSFVEATP
jgi:hypothetical protein